MIEIKLVPVDPAEQIRVLKMCQSPEMARLLESIRLRGKAVALQSFANSAEDQPYALFVDGFKSTHLQDQDAREAGIAKIVSQVIEDELKQPFLISAIQL